MKVRLLLFLEVVRSSYWFIPTLMLVASATLALLLVALDQKVETSSLRGFGWIFTGGAEGARSLLSTVAGSVIGVAGTTFSITIAVLSLTSSQFGPRLLWGFLRDTANQIVLGTFVGTFLYCLLVLRTVRNVEEVTFVPHIAVTGGVLLAVASVAVLIFFIHHVSNSIQASQIIANVAAELDAALDRLYPNEIRDVSDSLPDAVLAFEKSRSTASVILVRAQKSGYVQAVDSDVLLGIAHEKDLVIALKSEPGQFVTSGCSLAVLYPSKDDSLHGIEDQVSGAYTLGRRRTAAQDGEFLLLQLVEIAIRALSPGINDPFTAVMCLDRLGAALCHLTSRALPTAHHYDKEGQLRLITRPVSFDDMLESAFREIHHYGKNDPLILERLHEKLSQIRECARTEAQRESLRRIAVKFGNFEF